MRVMTVNSNTWHDIISHEIVRRIAQRAQFNGGPADYEFVHRDPMVVEIRNVPDLRFVLNDDVVVEGVTFKKQCLQHPLDQIIGVIEQHANKLGPPLGGGAT